jgi:hypothetical protein
MGSGRRSYEEGVPKKRPPRLSERGGAATAEGTPAGLRAAKQQCPEEVTMVLPPTETLPIGSQVSLIPDRHSPSGVALVHGNRLIVPAAESVTDTLRECVSQGVRYVGTIELYGTDPTSLAAFLRKE